MSIHSVVELETFKGIIGDYFYWFLALREFVDNHDTKSRKSIVPRMHLVNLYLLQINHLSISSQRHQQAVTQTPRLLNKFFDSEND
jgi:hypothetical protein